VLPLDTSFSPLRLDDGDGTTTKKSSMWSQLGVLGSRVVEAVFVSEDTEKSEGSGSECNSGSVTVGAAMEGSDAKVLIAKRMGVPKDEVDTRLIALSQKGELNGTAGRSSNRALGNSGKSPTLTKKDLEDFERAEADARSGTARAGTPFKAFKPAVLNGSATPKTPRTPPARPETPPARPETPATVHDDEVEIIPSKPPVQPQSWIDEMDAEEGDVEGPVQGKSEGSGVEEGTVVAEGQGVGVSEGSGSECNSGSVTVGAEVWPETRKRYAETVEAEHIYSAVGNITVPLLDEDDLGVEQLQFVVRDIVGQVNTANKLLATAGYVVAERSKEALQQARISSDMATESLLKAYEVSAVAASSSRQSWKMCVTFTGPDPRKRRGSRTPPRGTWHSPYLEWS
jgi:biotin carboxyl carrier protein